MARRDLTIYVAADTRGVVRANAMASKSFSALKTAATVAGAAMAAGLVKGAVASVKAASDLEEQMNKTRVVFRGSEKELLRWSKTTAMALGISRREALEATGTFGNMLVPMGLARDRAADMSKRMVQLAADMASFNNASPEETLDALRSGLAGETEPLRRFGVDLRVAALESFAMSKGIKTSYQELSNAQKAQLAYRKILHDTTDAQGDFRRTSGSLANQQRILRAQLENVAASIGKKLLPIAVKVARWASNFIDEMQRGEGAGGRFVDTLERAGDVLEGIWNVAKRIPPEVYALMGIAVAGVKIRRGLGFGGPGGGGGLGGLTGKMAPVPVFVTNWGGGPGGVPGGAGGKGGPKPSGVARFVRGVGWVVWPVGAAFGVGEALGQPDRGPRPGREGARGIGGGRGAATERLRMGTLERFGADPIAADPGGVARTTGRIVAQVRRMREETTGDLKKIRESAKANFDAIRQTMGLNTRRGKEAVTDNFAAALRAIRESVKQGRATTREGMSAIRDLIATHSGKGKDALRRNMDRIRDSIRETMSRGGQITRAGLTTIKDLFVQEARLYGLSPKQALAGANVRTGEVRGGFRRQDQQRGGPILGFGSGDIVPAMLEPGEVVINRNAVSAMGGPSAVDALNDLFPRFQRGGIVELLHPGNDPEGHGDHLHLGFSLPRLAVKMGRRLQRMGWLVGEHPAFGGVAPVHTGTSLHYSGRAIDVNWPDAGSEAAKIRALLPMLGQLAAGTAARMIRRVLVAGRSSPLKAVVQAGLDRARRAANRRLRSLTSMSVSMAGISGPNKAMGHEMMRRFGWPESQWPALLELWTRESGWSETARNPSSGAYGIPQALPPSKMGTLAQGSGTRAARAQIRWGLDYIRGRYGSPSSALAFHNAHNWYQRGGIVGARRGARIRRQPTRRGTRPERLVPLQGPRRRIIDLTTGEEWFGPKGATTGDETFGEDPNQPLIDALEARAEAERQVAEQLEALNAEVKRQNDINESTVAIGLREAQRALADMISGQIAGKTGQRGRSAGDGMVGAHY